MTTSRTQRLPRWLVVVAVGLWFALGGVRSAAAGNPDIRWRTLETEHFYVHYWAGNEEAAERVASAAEHAYVELTEAWGHSVFLKTHVTLTDVQDAANGRAGAVPYPQIVVYTTAPEALSVLESYDDWFDILITHELVHVVHLDTTHGLYRAINAIFGFGVLGKLTSPNVLQPRWVVEGVATMYESELSSQGRRHSAQFDAFIRMAVLDGTFHTLDQISSGARVWPHGTNVYLHGLHFMYYIAARYGADKLRELSHIYATQIPPFGINRAIERVVGITFYQLWKDYKADTTRRFEAQARRIRRRGLRQGRRLTFTGETTRYPFWSPDDHDIYFYKNDGHREEGIKRLDARGGRIREGIGIGRQGSDVDVVHVVDVEDQGEASPIGATGDLVFGQTGVYDNRYRWSDLWRWNGGDPKGAEQLTFGLRASEPHVSPDGRTVAFRRNDTAQSRLGLLDLASGKVTEVAPQGKISQVYTPRFAPDGERIAFSGWREGGYRDIYVYDRSSGVTERITADRFIDMSPNWSPDGRYIVFGSDRDDVYNIYAYDTRTRRLRQVTNVLGGAYEAAVSHDGKKLAYVGYVRTGYDLWVMDFDPALWIDPMPSTSALAPAEDPAGTLATSDGRPLALQSGRYQPIKTLYPRTIFPSFLNIQNISGLGSTLGFETGVSDVLGFHSLGAAFNYFVEDRIASGALQYTFARLYPTFTVRFSRNYQPRRGFARYLYDRPPGTDAYLVQGYRERITQVVARMSVPVVQHPRHRVSAGMGYAWTRWTNLDNDEIAVDPNAPATSLPEVGDAGSVDFSVSYASLGDGFGRFTYGSEQGRAANVALTVLDPRLGGDFGDIQANGSYREILPMPWRGHQTLSLELRGGVSAGGLRRRGAFCIGDFVYGGDVVRSLLQRTPFFTSCSAQLRGYEPVAETGRYFAVATAEYRIPLLDVDRGVGTLPFFFERVGLLPFVDVGNAWTSPIGVRDVLVGAGAGLLFAFNVGYGEPIGLLLQYAHGFDEELGRDTFRAIVSTVF